MKPLISCLVAALTLPLFYFPSDVHAQDVNPLKSAVVRIENSKQKNEVGAGFIVKIVGKNVYIVTAAHVVRGEHYPKTYLFSQGFEPLTATTINIEPDDIKGLALLRLEVNEPVLSTLTALKLGSTAELGNGEDVKIIGFPDSTAIWTVDSGNIKRLEGRNLVLSGAIRGGNSGGPVIRNQKAIGLITDVIKSDDGQLDGYAVRAETIVPYVNGLVANLISIEPDNADFNSLLTLKRIRVIHDGNKFGSGSWDFKIYINDNQTPIFYLSEDKYEKGKSIIPEDGKIPKPVGACALKSNEFVLKVVGTRSNGGDDQATGQARILCSQEGDILPPIAVQVKRDPKGKGSFDFYFALSNSQINVLEPKLINPSAVIDRRQDNGASNNELCKPLNEWLDASKGGFYSIVGTATDSETTFHPKIMVPGAVGGYVLPKERVYNYLLIDKDRGKVESQFYTAVSKVRSCLPKWEEKEDKSSTDILHKFRERKGTTIVVVSYTPVAQHGNYFLDVSVEIPGPRSIEW